MKTQKWNAQQRRAAKRLTCMVKIAAKCDLMLVTQDKKLTGLQFKANESAHKKQIASIVLNFGFCAGSRTVGIRGN